MKRNYELSVRGEFCAAHRLDGYPGNCKNTHGHNWGVTAYILCQDLDKIGMGMDFRDIKLMLREALSSLDHACLNDLAPFSGQNPTAENIARHLHQDLTHRLAQCAPEARVSRIRITETPGAEVTYWEEP
ncbi:MAG: 6-carboxytetrahydropterin synthase QueD [Humidesulfovibrio sp.]|uniref:6-carboxytetrahydropterin synthase QueD n=1 Tax=Humidesulfovibrio sp. TaxID=2910988 RepID=UPI002734A97B|nr:6-carboxytetrahydropterin synthase QueD [Humidesulfovibrio sp.]MDP2847198.1 6-carboxytetrahydropterin synthase QueD [Humidesulfovibrio sp.]